MTELTLKSLLRAKSEAAGPITALLSAMDGPLAIEDSRGTVLFGAPQIDAFRAPVPYDGSPLGWVIGPRPGAEALSALLGHLAAREQERRALGAEVLHLYREVHLIDQLSEELTAVLDIGAACGASLDQARRLIPASSGGILVRGETDGTFRYAARFGDESELLETDSEFITAILERGLAEIVNAGQIAVGLAHAPAHLRSLLFAPLRAKQRCVGVILLASGDGYAYTAANLKLLNTIALQTAAAIENSLLCAEMVDTARDREQFAALQRELETARAIQHSLAPRTFPPFPGRDDFDLHAQMVSARHVGGDFFNYFFIDEDRLAVVIGDVSGKGTPSALFMAVTHTHVRTVALRCPEPAECMAEVNRILVADKASSMYATCFYGILNTRTGEFRYCNAGHNPPFRIAADGTVRALDCTGGFPLGLFAGDYEDAAVHLDAGETLFLYTDGVSEATNEDDEEFGETRLMKIIGSASPRGPRDTVAAVKAALMDHCGAAPQSDDITMIAVRRS